MWGDLHGETRWHNLRSTEMSHVLFLFCFFLLSFLPSWVYSFLCCNPSVLMLLVLISFSWCSVCKLSVPSTKVFSSSSLSLNSLWHNICPTCTLFFLLRSSLCVRSLWTSSTLAKPPPGTTSTIAMSQEPTQHNQIKILLERLSTEG